MPKGLKAVLCPNVHCDKKGVPQNIHASKKTCPSCGGPVSAKH
jgi:hypothetical protein